MNRPNRPLARKEMRWGLRMLLIATLLVTSVASDQAIASLSRPYLMVIGAVTLRFAEAKPPLPLMPPRETKAPPPSPETPPPAMPPASTPQPPRVQESIPPSSTVIPPLAKVEKSDPEPARPTIPSLLPDDTRTDVKPEDFLPYFQMPGSSTHPGVTVPPTSGALPPSSATYRQQ